MSEIAIVTGASRGIGLEISRTLLTQGYIVYGIGRDFSECSIKDNNFFPVTMDLRDNQALLNKIREIKESGKIKVLVNNAGCAYYGLHEELNPEKISEMVRVNFEVPMILVNQCLRDLKNNDGYVINISSVTATHASPHACSYGATKAGLSAFSKSLFEEQRKYGLKVINIEPDLTDTSLYRNADFTTDENDMAHLFKEDIAKAIDFCLSNREGSVVTNMTIRPQINRIKKK